MRVFVNLAAGFCIAGASSAANVAGATGAISGTVNYCEHGGVLGMKIALSGRQSFIYTAADGAFVFDTVPHGSYALFYTIDETLVHISQSITVRKGETTRLGEIAFCGAAKADALTQKSLPNTACPPRSKAPECADNDKDGVAAASDCNDRDERIRPGAQEICDGIDNDCNGAIDDLAAVKIENGEGACRNGAIAVTACNQGFADCDAKADNGCETDFMRDNDNCGRCGNACPSLEICIAGIC